jgi:hypothetical protein
MRIGAADIDGQRHAASVGQHGPLDAEFPAIGRVFPGFFPRPVATWSSPRPCFAIPTECLSTRRIPEEKPSTICERHPTRSTPESNCAAYCPSHTHAAPLSIGSRYAKYRRCRWRFAVAASVAVHLYGLRDISATRGLSAPTTHPEDTKHKDSVSSCPRDFT